MTVADEEIATLAREAPHDPMARYRWRCALVRAGRGAEAGFEEGDEVSVGPCEVNEKREPVAKAVLSIPWTGALLEARWPDRGPALDRVNPDCMHTEAWTLLTPAKPKGDPS